MGNKQEIWWMPYLNLFARMSGWVAFPVLVGTLIGRWLDKKYDTEPWLMIASVGISFIISMAGLIKEAMKEYKNIEK